jgi:hypothetical protein
MGLMRRTVIIRADPILRSARHPWLIAHASANAPGPFSVYPRVGARY